ncbi:hypothetical protein OROMI_034059 [Orobanche minor]
MANSCSAAARAVGKVVGSLSMYPLSRKCTKRAGTDIDLRFYKAWSTLVKIGVHQAARSPVVLENSPVEGKETSLGEHIAGENHFAVKGEGFGVTPKSIPVLNSKGSFDPHPFLFLPHQLFDMRQLIRLQ